MDATLRGQLAALGAWSDRLADPTFAVGAWAGGDRQADGSISMPWYELSPEAEAFRRDIVANGWIEAFEWMAWLKTPDGRHLRDEPAAIEAAGPDDLRRLLTAIIRSERFSDGSIAGAHESGLLGRICRRAGVLAGRP